MTIVTAYSAKANRFLLIEELPPTIQTHPCIHGHYLHTYLHVTEIYNGAQAILATPMLINSDGLGTWLAPHMNKRDTYYWEAAGSGMKLHIKMNRLRYNTYVNTVHSTMTKTHC